MSFWAAIDEREKQKKASEQQLRQFLIEQQNELKNRKIIEKAADINEYRKLNGESQLSAKVNTPFI